MKQTKKHIKVNDKIQVISGKEKGLIGTIDSIFSKKSRIMVIVKEAPLRNKKVKSTKDKIEDNKKGIPIPIHISNVSLWKTKTKKVS